MKRYGNLFDNIASVENIQLAHKNASKGKKHYDEVKMVNSNIEHYSQEISKMLHEGRFDNSKYKVFTKLDKGKEREIYKLPYYPDRIVHHAIMQVLEPIWIKTLIPDTFQSIKGRGIHKAKRRIEPVVRSGKVKYCLKMDIQKFYPSIDNKILQGIIEKKVKCKRTLQLLNKVLYSIEGVPIGNYLSQYFGNLYLTYFDHWVKEELKVKYYYRYCDDIVLLSNTKLELHIMLGRIKVYLDSKLKLRLKRDYQVFRISRGIDFLGFRFFNRYTLIRKRITRSFIRACKEFVATASHAELARVISYYGWVKVADGHNLWRSYKSRVENSISSEYNTNTKLIRGRL